MQYGIVGQTAPELKVKHWIDLNGKNIEPLTLDSMGSAIKVIYCFQSWCPACHSIGFPTLQSIFKNYQNNAIAKGDLHLAVIQTVFEGKESNRLEKLAETQQQYNLSLPFAHDDAAPYPKTMLDYRTGGTPWIIIIDRDNQVLFNDFHISSARAIELIDKLLKIKGKANG